MTRHPPCTQHISHTYALWQLWQLWNMDRPDMTGSKQNEILMTWVLLNPNESGGGHRESHLGPDTPREPRRQPPGDVGEALRLGPEADLELGATGTDADRCWPMLIWFWPGWSWTHSAPSLLSESVRAGPKTEPTELHKVSLQRFATEKQNRESKVIWVIWHEREIRSLFPQQTMTYRERKNMKNQQYGKEPTLPNYPDMVYNRHTCMILYVCI